MNQLLAGARLVRRSVYEIIRVPAAALPAVVAPTLFVLGLTAAFGKLNVLPGFTTTSYLGFLIPIGFLQAAAFAGVAVGVNLGRDIETGLFDRLLAAPAGRITLLAGLILSAGVRVLLPVAVLLLVAFPLGVEFSTAGGFAFSIALAVAFALVAAAWSVTIALRFKTQFAAPLMQATTLVVVLFTPAYAPEQLLAGWLADIARANPVSDVVTATRDGLLGDLTWAAASEGMVTVAALLAVTAFLARRGVRRLAI